VRQCLVPNLRRGESCSSTVCQCTRPWLRGADQSGGPDADLAEVVFADPLQADSSAAVSPLYSQRASATVPRFFSSCANCSCCRGAGRPRSGASRCRRSARGRPAGLVRVFREPDLLYPIDRVDLWIARIAMLCNPFLHATAPGIVSRECEKVRAPVFGEQIGELRGAELHVVALVAQETHKLGTAARRIIQCYRQQP
jgi:hypothetical protein